MNSKALLAIAAAAVLASAAARADVRAEYIDERDQVAAMTAEDSGSSHLAQTRVRNHLTTLAVTPVNGL